MFGYKGDAMGLKLLHSYYLVHLHTIRLAMYGLGILGDLNSLVKLELCRTACGLGECDKIECLYLKRDRAGIKVTVDKSDLSSKRNELN